MTVSTMTLSIMQLSTTAILCHFVMLSVIIPDYTRRLETQHNTSQHNRVNYDTDWTINNVMLRVSMCRGMKYNNLEHDGTQHIGLNIPFLLHQCSAWRRRKPYCHLAWYKLFAECRNLRGVVYVEGLYAKRHYVECRYADCRCALTTWSLLHLNWFKSIEACNF